MQSLLQPPRLPLPQNGGILEGGDLHELGVTQAAHQHALMDSASRLPTPLHPHRSSYTLPDTVEAWLDSIRLPQYAQNFHKNGFGDMERVRKVWEIELTTVLEITRLGHRKRILASLGERPLEPELPASLNPHDLSLELTKLVRGARARGGISCICRLTDCHMIMNGIFAIRGNNDKRLSFTSRVE